MKQKVNILKRQAYVAPKMEVIGIESQTVLCGSGMRSNNTEGVTISGFDWI